MPSLYIAYIYTYTQTYWKKGAHEILRDTLYPFFFTYTHTYMLENNVHMRYCEALFVPCLRTFARARTLTHNVGVICTLGVFWTLFVPHIHTLQGVICTQVGNLAENSRLLMYIVHIIYLHTYMHSHILYMALKASG